MEPLVIDYRLDGTRPGYQFTTPTGHLRDDVLRHVWRHAMPRGQGWGANGFIGARSLKCFPLPDGRVAASVTRVTDRVDEMQRQGIRRAEITLMSRNAYQPFLETLAGEYPEAAQFAAGEQFSSVLWKRLLDRIIPSLRSRRQVVLTHNFRDEGSWQAVEVILLKLVTSRAVRLLEGWSADISFTTLALDWREESRIVALPASHNRSLNGVTAIHLS